MYKDIEAKILFHKERIIKEFIKYGIYPEDETIKERLNNIDTSLSFFKHDKAVSGEHFNTKSYNNMLNMLYKDLELLYQLLYEITAKQFTTLKAFADTHLDDLESMSNKYKLKASQEVSSTTLGKTIFFKHTDFDLHIKDNVTIVDIGNVDLNKGSRISCFLNANNIEPEKVLFGLKAENEEPMYVTAYNYNQDSIVVPGMLERTSYETKIDDQQVITGPIEMNLDNNQASYENAYIILGGKNKMLVKKFDERSTQFVIERPTSLNMSSFDGRCYIDFYVVGGNQITFRFNKKPLSANFPIDDYRVTNLKHIHHFFIECEDGFSFNFELDRGSVYAIKENGTINNNKLYFSRSINVRDFYVAEYKTGKPDTYYAFVKIINDDGVPIDIESIYIKELLSIGGDI